jgi:hypothetical protein
LFPVSSGSAKKNCPRANTACEQHDAPVIGDDAPLLPLTLLQVLPDVVHRDAPAVRFSTQPRA